MSSDLQNHLSTIPLSPDGIGYVVNKNNNKMYKIEYIRDIQPNSYNDGYREDRFTFTIDSKKHNLFIRNNDREQLAIFLKYEDAFNYWKDLVQGKSKFCQEEIIKLSKQLKSREQELAELDKLLVLF